MFKATVQICAYELNLLTVFFFAAHLYVIPCTCESESVYLYSVCGVYYANGDEEL